MARNLALGAILLAPVGSAQTFNPWDFRDDLGTLRKTQSGVPRVQATAADINRDRWRTTEDFASRYVQERGMPNAGSFEIWRVHEDLGQAHIRLKQRIGGLPVVGADLIVHADLETGKVAGVNGLVAYDQDLPRTATIEANDAIRKAIAEFGFAGARVERAPELVYVVDPQRNVRLAWSSYVSYSSANGAELDRVFADALTGSAVTRHPQIMRAKNREMYDCANQSTWANCTFMFSDSTGTPYDSVAIAGFDNAGIAYDYFSGVHSQDSLNDNGVVIKQAVHVGSSSNTQAGWFTSPVWTVIGYGDNGANPSPAECVDVVTHEITHGIGWHMLSLISIGEAGAINEGISDVFGAAAEAWDAGAVTSATWQIGENCYASPVRYLDDPRSKANHADYYPTRKGDIHGDAGITGLAFYLVSQGGSSPRGPETFSVSAQGISVAEAIFFKALVTYGYSSMSFRDWRDATLSAATALYGAFSSEYNAVWNAWAAVGNNWDSRNSSLTTGSSWTSASYTTSTVGYHTGQYAGPSGFHLFLEYWDGSTWIIADSVTSCGNKLIEYYTIAGTWRWRIYANSGSGAYSLYYNKPK
ncbi:MAG: M4 family metallopeptidase [Thermoanaerobaculia bacterium]